MNTNVSARTLHRRTVLRGFGAVISLPFLEAMLPNRGLLAASPNSKPPLRMAYFYVPNGANMANWTPVGTGGPLGDLTPTLQPLAPFKNKFSVLTGLTLDGAFDHGDGGGDHARSIAAFLTGAHPRKTEGADIKNDVSVDQVAAGKLGSATRFASLELGLEGSSQSGGCDSGYSCAYSSNMSWRNETTPVPKETDPGAVFDRLFGGLTKAEMVKSKDIRKKFRKSVLDFAVDDAKRLQGQLGQLDRQRRVVSFREKAGAWWNSIIISALLRWTSPASCGVRRPPSSEIGRTGLPAP